jgi:hypothetical protein
MIMTTHTRMLTSVALTAATLVTLSSDALARGGFGGGFGGMRSVARAPMVVSKAPTNSASSVRRTSATTHTSSSGTKTSQTKTHSCKNDCSDHHHHKPPMNWMPPMMPASGSQVGSDTSSPAPEASGGDVQRSVVARDHRKVSTRDHRKDEDRDDRDDRDDREDSESSGPKDSSPLDSSPRDSGPQDSSPQGGSSREVVVNDRGGTRAAAYPVATLPSGPNQGSGGSNGGVTVVKEHPIRPNPLPPTSAGTGAAPTATTADQPNCVYERTVQKRPDGGLQRVVLKVCPDA